MGKCFNGRHLESKGLTVPCGKCAQCKTNEQIKWASRIIQENIAHNENGKPSAFVTFTYDEKSLPLTNEGLPTLQKTDFRKWINNARNAISPFRHFTTGEYGSLYGRPHIHMAVFPEHSDHILQLARHWEKDHGHANVKALIGARCAYLAKYTTKSLTTTKANRLRGDQEPEFHIQSRGLGLNFARMVATTYHGEKGQRVLDKTGDIHRTFRNQGKIHPMTDYTLGKIRKFTNVPALHSERLMHDNYESYFPIQEAEKCPKKHRAMEAKIRGKATSKIYRTQYQRL
ncbi:replication initiator protein [Microviridae sp.]|nr:replication initiator protein [Microviridae sp.]